MAAALSPQKKRDLRVLMGRYRANAFDHGGFAPVSVPFSLRLISCSAEVWRRVITAVRFAGVTLRGRIPMFFWPAAEIIGNAGIGTALLMTSSGKSYLTRYASLHAHFNVRNDFCILPRYQANFENMTPGRIHSSVVYAGFTHEDFLYTDVTQCKIFTMLNSIKLGFIVLLTLFTSR